MSNDRDKDREKGESRNDQASNHERRRDTYRDYSEEKGNVVFDTLKPPPRPGPGRGNGNDGSED